MSLLPSKSNEYDEARADTAEVIYDDRGALTPLFLFAP